MQKHRLIAVCIAFVVCFCIHLPPALAEEFTEETTAAVSTLQLQEDTIASAVDGGEDEQLELPSEPSQEQDAQDETSRSAANEMTNPDFDPDPVFEYEVESEPEPEPAPTSEPEEEFDSVELLQEGEYPSIVQSEAPTLSQNGPRKRLLARSTSNAAAVEELIVNSLSAYQERISFPNTVEITAGEFRTLYQNVLNKHPEFFFVSSGYSFAVRAGSGDGDNRIVSYVRPQYIFDRSSLPTEVANFNSEMDKFISWVPANADTATTVKALHDWLVRNVSYDMDSYEYSLFEYENRIQALGSLAAYAELISLYGHVHSAYGALVERKALCQGYALAMKLALDYFGIENDIVTSDDLNHMWNVVNVDGSWYMLDVTWDDEGGNETKGFSYAPQTRYFLKSATAFGHVPQSSWQFVSGTVRNCTSTTYDTVSPWTVWGPAVSFSLQDQTLAPNTSFTMTLNNLVPQNVRCDGIVWESSNPDIASIDANGIITSNTKTGTTTITCVLDGISASCTLTVKQSTSRWERLAGKTALLTMQKIVQKGFSTASNVVIATNKSYKDALSAASLAGLKNAPILLTNPNALSSQTKSEIVRLGARTAYIVGGPSAVATSVETELKACGITSVKRIWGKNAPDTSRQVALSVGNTYGTVIVATSKDFADALSIAPFAYAMRVPIILTESNKLLSQDSIKLISQLKFKNAILVGGTSAVPATVATQLTQIGLSVERLWGDTAVLTSAKIAQWELKHGFTISTVGVATRTSYKDALCGAALLGRAKGPIILVNGNNKAAVDIVIKPQASKVVHGYILGGTSVVSQANENYIMKL